MTIQSSESRAAAAIERRIGPTRDLYDYNKSLVEAFWPEISEFHVAWMARVASELELDILREEVIWYQGRPYVTIKGLVRLLNRHPQFDNFELEPASEELRKAMRVARDEEQVWVCRLWRKDRSRSAIGYGRATPEDTFVGYGRVNDKAQDLARYIAERVSHRTRDVRQAIHVAQLCDMQEEVDRFESGTEPARPR